jgi:hypothetical protein
MNLTAQDTTGIDGFFVRLCNCLNCSQEPLQLIWGRPLQPETFQAK